MDFLSWQSMGSGFGEGAAFGNALRPCSSAAAAKATGGRFFAFSTSSFTFGTRGGVGILPLGPSSGISGSLRLMPFSTAAPNPSWPRMACTAIDSKSAMLPSCRPAVVWGDSSSIGAMLPSCRPAVALANSSGGAAAGWPPL